MAAKLKLWYVELQYEWGDSYEVEARTRKEAENNALELAEKYLHEDVHDNPKGNFSILDIEIEDVLE